MAGVACRGAQIEKKGLAEGMRDIQGRVWVGLPRLEEFLGRSSLRRSDGRLEERVGCHGGDCLA
jgi:hypothetical protein